MAPGSGATYFFLEDVSDGPLDTPGVDFTGSGVIARTIDAKGEFPRAAGQNGNGLPYFYVWNGRNADGTLHNLADAILEYQSGEAGIFVCPLAPQHDAPDPDTVVRGSRWNYVYMPSFVRGTYVSPIKNLDRSSSEDALWGEHTANVGPSWGRFRSNHASDSIGIWDDEDDRGLGPSYAQWSSMNESDIESIANVFVDGSARLLQTQEMYRMSTSFGTSFVPPNSEYKPSN